MQLPAPSSHLRTTIGPVIGQWQVIDSSAIPEPSTYAALAGLATLAFAALRRPRRASLSISK